MLVAYKNFEVTSDTAAALRKLEPISVKGCKSVLQAEDPIQRTGRWVCCNTVLTGWEPAGEGQYIYPGPWVGLDTESICIASQLVLGVWKGDRCIERKAQVCAFLSGVPVTKIDGILTADIVQGLMISGYKGYTLKGIVDTIWMKLPSKQ